MRLPLCILTAPAAAAAALGGNNNLQQPLAVKPSTIPSLGFGTWNLDKSNVTQAVSAALQAGYRHLDCATIYGNQKEVGKGIADGLKKAGVNRTDVWITSKLWNDHHNPNLVQQALDQTLSDLGLDYLDLWLMHWPVASSADGTKLDYLHAWHAMEKLHQTNKLRNIGVSNFSPAQLKDIIQNSDTKPAVHQFEMHPYLPQQDWVATHEALGIAVTAYSPFANTNPTYNSGHDDPPFLLKNTDMVAIADERGCTTAQVALVWGMSRGYSVIPKSSHLDHIKENFGALGCKLHRGDLDRIDALSDKYLKRFNNPSKSYGVKLFDGLQDSLPAYIILDNHGLHTKQANVKNASIRKNPSLPPYPSTRSPISSATHHIPSTKSPILNPLSFLTPTTLHLHPYSFNTHTLTWRSSPNLHRPRISGEKSQRICYSNEKSSCIQRVAPVWGP
ncbi:MAG: hypothetical protein Q9210_004031 [Variospora velana]